MSALIEIRGSSSLRTICLQQQSRVKHTLQRANVLSTGATLEDFLQRNKLADPNESVFGVFKRAARFLADAGKSFTGPARTKEDADRFLHHMCHFEIIPGSPILANAGRREHKSVSACSIPPVRFSNMSKEEIARIVSSYHTRGMGTGFNMDESENPIEMVKYLNRLAISEVQSGLIERSVGNMGVLSIDHPDVIDFIRIRVNHPEIKEWKFNLSVNLTEDFFKAWLEGAPFVLRNGRTVDPHFLMQQIAENAHATGDPGLIFMDRINALNRVPQVGRYKTVVPCGEVSLHEGEVCQFAYLNVTSFIKDGMISKSALKEAVHAAITMLDNAVEANIPRMPNAMSQQQISYLRRIGLGLCGFAETLQAVGLPYDSHEGRSFAQDLMSFINFESKSASINLAKERGPFKLFDDPETRRDLFLEPFSQRPTRFVLKEDWQELKSRFDRYKIRNLATTILPPTGRSSLMAGVTGSIEPPFRLVDDSLFRDALRRQCTRYGYAGDLDPIFDEVGKVGSIQHTSLPGSVRDIFKTALEISPIAHVRMTAAFQRHVDEGISKTVNLPSRASVEDVSALLLLAHQSGLKGITVYRDGCRTLQPKALNKSKDASMTSDAIYGSMHITPRISKLLNSPLLQRLRGIHQNGVDYLIDPRLSASRFEHSVGVMMLTQLLGGTESNQVTALLHDISHTTFSHVVDQVFQLVDQDYHSRKFHDFLTSPATQTTLQENQITETELDYRNVPMITGSGLNADRLDYMIRDLLQTNGIFQPEYSSILNDLTMGENGEIVCKTQDTARLIFRKFLQVNKEVYFNPLSEAAALVMASILKKMLEEGSISENDLFTTDDHLVEKIKASRFNAVFEAINPKMEFHPGSSSDPFVCRKLRAINPRIAGLPGLLTDHCPASAKELEEYQKTPTKIHYRIPLLSQIV